MWIDSHCHITADDYREDRDRVLERAEQAGVETLIAVGAGYGLEHNERALQLAAANPRIFATVGVHPHDAEKLDDAGRSRLRQWLGHPRVVAVGECGLDYYYENSPREIQRQVFAEHLALARENDLPVVIHVRDRGEDAYRELMEIWKSEGGDRLSGLLHCYSHDLPFARRAVDEGFFVSFSGILTFKRAGPLREVAAALPGDRLLVETDAPLLAPEGFRGKRNEPARVVRVGEALARARGRPPEAIADETAANTRRFFRLHPPVDSE
jgi:TatD DNase family protein